MKRLFVPLAACLLSFAAHAQEAEDPFADVVEMRHGLMLQLATDISKLGTMAKGDTPYDAATATRAAANVAAIASVISMDQFPAGSEVGKAADSFALPAIWANPDDFMAKITALNTAAAAMVSASGTDLAGLQGGMAALGGACSACHKDYRQPEE
jgi:cytochrome c556